MRLGHPVPDPPAMGYVVLIVKGAVPVVVSMANRAAYTVASCFPIEETVPLFPSIVGTRNPRDDRTVLITVTNPIQTLLVSHAHLLTGSSRIQRMQGLGSLNDARRSLEHLFRGRSPVPVHSLFHQRVQGMEDLCKMGQKCSPVTQRPPKCLELFHSGRGRLCLNFIYHCIRGDLSHPTRQPPKIGQTIQAFAAWPR